MAKKNKAAPLAPPASSSSSSGEDSSPPPPNSPPKNPSPDSTDHEKRSKEVSTEDDSSEDSGSNPPLLISESRNPNNQAANTSSSDLDPPQQPIPPPQSPLIYSSVSDSEDEFQNHSDSIMVADPSLMPFSSKPMDGENPVAAKRSASPSAPISEKKRRAGDAVEAKKDISRRIWSKADELSLLQTILDYKENHRVIPSTQTQLKSLLKALNDSLSASVTLSQLNAKMRVLRKKHNNAAELGKRAKNQNVSNAHSDVVFDQLNKIWGSNKDSRVLESKIKGKVEPFAVEYPFLHWFLKSEHHNNGLVFESHMPIANELEGDCKKLERAEIQLHMRKIKLLPSALKLIESTLVE